MTALEIVERLLDEASDSSRKDAKDFLLLNAREPDDDREISFGWAVSTSNEHLIKDRLAEDGVDPDDPEIWNTLNKDVERLEHNSVELLRFHGLDLRAEGHDDDELAGSGWVTTNSHGWTFVKKWDVAERDEPLSTTSGSIWSLETDVSPRLFDGVSELGQRVIDVDIRFFDVEKLQNEIEQRGTPFKPLE